MPYRAFLEAVTDGAGRVDFLQPAYIERANAFLRLPDEIVKAFVREIESIRASDGLRERAIEFHRQLFHGEGTEKDVNDRLLAMGPEAGMFAAVVYVGGLPKLIETYMSRNIPDGVLADTLGDLEIWMNHHRRKHGDWGLSQLGWLIRHFTGSLFRLGRLQFMFIPYDKKVKVLRHRSTGQVAALADTGVAFRADGQVDGTNGVSDRQGRWVSRYEFDGVRHIGHPISADGHALRDAVALPAAEWELVLAEGDTVFDVHIPEGSKMSHERCRDAYGQAIAFAANHFPEVDFKAFVCTSWLLAPQFRQLLPAESNIVKFQSDYYVTPVLADENQTLERVFGFGTKLADLPDVPRETSLQRIVYEHLAAGGRIHGAAGFMLREHWETGTRLHARY